MQSEGVVFGSGDCLPVKGEGSAAHPGEGALGSGLAGNGAGSRAPCSTTSKDLRMSGDPHATPPSRALCPAPGEASLPGRGGGGGRGRAGSVDKPSPSLARAPFHAGKRSAAGGGGTVLPMVHGGLGLSLVQSCPGRPPPRGQSSSECPDPGSVPPLTRITPGGKSSSCCGRVGQCGWRGTRLPWGVGRPRWGLGHVATDHPTTLQDCQGNKGKNKTYKHGSRLGNGVPLFICSFAHSSLHSLKAQ